ncbi:9810_t:CDS:2 [Paraglomus brasilianum]|uniref:mitochondrial intermediate peptidase n=1 Tax=Paraglomus brasilianum TaxID=144538 RepID=A0A9N9F2J0_9GLOM|nr:9810_t:CDS:2 [Paraglomus brasilianum]
MNLNRLRHAAICLLRNSRLYKHYAIFHTNKLYIPLSIKRLLYTETATDPQHTKRIPGLCHANIQNSNDKCHASANDDVLRVLFDDQRAWERFSKHKSLFDSRTSSGLFRNQDLATPTGFEIAAQKALRRAELLVQRISNAETKDELRKVVKNLDRASDILCSVIDLAEFVRTAHPDQSYVRAATWAYEYLCSYMNTLNTNTNLYKALKRVLSMPSIAHDFSPEELQVATIFLRDFEKSGIHLPEKDRQRFVDISDKIIALGRQFTQTPPVRAVKQIEVSPASSLEGLNPGYVKDVTREGEQVAVISTNQGEAQMVMKYCRNEEVRKQMYLAINSAKREQVEVLEDLLRTRAELAKLVGMDSYGHMFLVDKMARGPEHVQTFLHTLADQHKPKALADLRLLQEAKRSHIGSNDSALPTVNAWDRDFYIDAVVSFSSSQRSTPISPYFSVGSVIQGLSRLFSHLFGISFQPAEILPGEVWHEDVRKLDVIDEKEGKIGIIYCDLFSRQGKISNAAHYTVRCSRRVDDDDVEGDIPSGADHNEIGELAEGGEGVVIGGKPGKYQLPIIALMCDFSRTGNRDGPALLSLIEVETLFHEMGHAMHSMIGRTDFHSVSGTRCSTDFVEIPSILMEHFVYSPEVLKLFAKHYETREDIPIDLIRSHAAARSTFSAIETQSQILMALLDQIYHSPLLASTSFDTTAILAKLQDTIGPFPSAQGTAWQIQFGHLFGYGAGYYSYLFGRVLAGKIWKVLFQDNPLSREAGMRFKEEILKWGGSRDPWVCVGEVLEDERLMAGDTQSMVVVGEWVDSL